MNIAILSAMSTICLEASSVASTALQTLPEPAPIVLAQAEIPAQSPTVEPAPVTTHEVAAPIFEENVESFVAEEAVDPALLAFAGESDEAVAAKLTDYLQELGTMNGAFRQVSPSGAVSTGQFYLRRPGLLRFEYDDPSPLLIVANGGLVYVRDEALETTDSYPVSQTPLKFLLQKKIDFSEAEIVSVDRGIGNFAVTFATKGDETQGELTIVSSAPSLGLTRWVVRDVQNGITEVTLDGVVTGDRIANRMFRVPDAGGNFLKN